MPNNIYAGPVEMPSPTFVEGNAAAALKPGTVVTPGFDVGVAATDGLFLVLAEGGPGKGEGIEYNYVTGNAVKAYNLKPGHRAYVRVAAGITAVRNLTLLERTAAGRLQVKTTGVAVAVAKESKVLVSAGSLLLVEAL